MLVPSRWVVFRPGVWGFCTISWSLPGDEVQGGNSSSYKFGYVGGRSSKTKLLVSIGMGRNKVPFELLYRIMCYSRYKYHLSSINIKRDRIDTFEDDR